MAKNAGIYDAHLDYDVLVNQTGGIPGYVIGWCEQNIKNKWGWYFDEQNALLTFSNSKDCTLAALHWAGHKR